MIETTNLDYIKYMGGIIDMINTRYYALTDKGIVCGSAEHVRREIYDCM